MRKTETARMGAIPTLLVVLLIICLSVLWNQNSCSNLYLSGASTTYYENDASFVYSRFLRQELADPSACKSSQRYGHKGDGGWDVCLDELKPNDCLIYSAGTKDDVSFDLEIIEQQGCTVHAFDPTLMFQLGEEKAPKFVSEMKEKGISFHDYGLGGRTLLYPPHTIPWAWPGLDFGVSSNEQTWMLKTLPDIYKELGHDFVDVVKIDIEGSEWEILENLLSNSRTRHALQQGKMFHQIMLEVHFIPKDNDMYHDRFPEGIQHPSTEVRENFNLHGMDMIQQLMGLGFVIWKHDVNYGSPKITDPASKKDFRSCHEIYLKWAQR